MEAVAMNAMAIAAPGPPDHSIDLSFSPPALSA